MEAPSPISIEYDSLKDKKEVIKKEYNIEINNEKYNLEISIDNHLINIKINKINNLELIYYENKYNLKEINNILCINSNIYKNLEEVLEFIDLAYKNNKIIINYSRENEINIIIKYIIVYKEYECIIKLNKKEIEINEKFKIILNEIILLKKIENKRINDILNNIENILIDIKNKVNLKLEENENKIKELKKEIENNQNCYLKNKEQIILIHNEISKIKYPEIIKFYKKYNLDEKEMNIYKLDLNGKWIGDKGMKI